MSINKPLKLKTEDAVGVRIIYGKIEIVSDLNKKSGCILFLGAYYTRKITVIHIFVAFTFVTLWTDSVPFLVNIESLLRVTKTQ